MTSALKIRIRGLYKAFGDNVVLDNLDPNELSGGMQKRVALARAEGPIQMEMTRP